MNTQKYVQKSRLLIQLIFWAIVTFMACRHVSTGGGPKGAPNIHAICPFGGLETLYKLASENAYIHKLNSSNIVLLIGTIALALIVGRYFCGWLCALGTMQEICAKIGRRIFKKTFTVPAALDKPLRYFKYIVFFTVLFLSWKTASLIIDPFDPFAAYAHIPAGLEKLFSEFFWGTIILVLSLLLSVFFDRVFCKYLCPLGAFLGLVSKLSFYKIKRDTAACINCGRCANDCPVNIPVDRIAGVDSPECINCLQCVTSCPEKINSLKPHIANRRVKTIVIAVAGLAIYTGIIVAANALGYWQLKGGKNKQHFEKSLNTGHRSAS